VTDRWSGASLEVVGEDPELRIVDFSEAPGAAECRERHEHALAEARRRYRDHLAAVFDVHGVEQPGAVADVALDALTVWRYVDTDERCLCSCHPRLPDSELHDYGFGCTCARTPGDRRRATRQWFSSIDEFWCSPEGRQISAGEWAAEADLQAWLARQPGVVVGGHGGFAPEQWWGEVDGHRFYFRERHDAWRIELDLRPSGRFARVFAGVDDDGNVRTTPREIEEGDVVASGLTDAEGYGTTPVVRAMFIVDTIRTHLTRRACTLHHDDLSTVETLLDRQIGWCPACGARLAPSYPPQTQYW
jgi:hypothetical protein